MKKFAIVLAGSGVFDGSEIHEAILAMLAVRQQGAIYEIFAPDIEQHHVINHLTGEETDERRNVLVESARIARGKIRALSAFSAADFDALLIPGGFGAAKNLSTIAFDGAEAKVDPELEQAVKEMYDAGKPIGALCISPAIIARILEGVEVTIGNDRETIEAIKGMGGKHKETTHGEVVADKKYKVYTTPCYMLDANIEQIYEGALNLIREMMKEISN